MKTKYAFQRSYWFPKSFRVNPNESTDKNSNKLAFEAEPSHLKRTVCIKNISKVNMFLLYWDSIQYLMSNSIQSNQEL